MSNPMEEFLEEAGLQKEALHMPEQVGNFARQVGGGVAAGLGAAGAAGIVGGVALAAGKVYDAMTKSRDFRAVLQHNQDIAEHHARDPRTVNQFYSSLRTMNPDFAKDPIVAGTFMRQMIDNPMAAGGILANQTVPSRDKFRGHDPAEHGMSAAGRFFAPPKRG